MNVRTDSFSRGMYRSFAYHWTGFTVEVPFLLIASLLFGVPFYWWVSYLQLLSIVVLTTLG